MPDSEKEKKLAASRALAKILDDLLGSADWDASLFLKTTKKRILELKAEAEQLVEKYGGNPRDTEATQDASHLEGYVKVYILLYQAHGRNMQFWQSMLKSLDRYSITRPVYGNESYIQEFIRSRQDADCQGYAAVAVKKSDIIHFDNPSLDRLGNELLTLKERAVTINNIIEFVHANKEHYKYKDGQLVLSK